MVLLHIYDKYNEINNTAGRFCPAKNEGRNFF